MDLLLIIWQFDFCLIWMEINPVLSGNDFPKDLEEAIESPGGWVKISNFMSLDLVCHFKYFLTTQSLSFWGMNWSAFFQLRMTSVIVCSFGVGYICWWAFSMKLSVFLCSVWVCSDNILGFCSNSFFYPHELFDFSFKICISSPCCSSFLLISISFLIISFSWSCCF
jgi:hypothetical protein